jgi:hypothetical protein
MDTTKTINREKTGIIISDQQIKIFLFASPNIKKSNFNLPEGEV